MFHLLKKSLYISTFLIASTFAMPAMAQDDMADIDPLVVPDEFPSIEDELEMGEFIRGYLMSNPEVIIEAVEAYSARKKLEEQQKANDSVKENADWLYSNDDHPDAGNPDANISIVEFFDYNCGYCKRALSDVMTVLGEDDQVRVVFVELPILGEASTEASKWALAAHKQNLYLEYHVALMEHQGRLNEVTLATIAEKVGLDLDKLRSDKEEPEIMEQLNENINMARTLGITGTPAFTIGEDLARGYVGLDGLKAGIEQNRAKMKSAE
jgi:protein-disulfide isomerase